MTLALCFFALLLERLIGYPQWLVHRIGHPVIWMGNYLSFLEKKMNSESATKLTGLIAWSLYVLPCLIIGIFLRQILSTGPWGFGVQILLATTLLAQKSLHDHVKAVADALGQSIHAAREKVSLIVGRDPSQLDEAGVSRAALESLAENASDGIFAPAFWLAVAGLPGLIVYKAINTADSMIGHKSDRYLHFGWAAARTDDLANLIPARFAGLIFALASFRPEAFSAMWRDAGHHLSPNAGWPEAALAGGLGISLGGPRSYDGKQVDLARMGDGRSELNRQDILDGLKLYARALSLATCLIGLAAIAFSL
jgi:adenosylcobinamide-phosphate synthase